MNKGKNGSILLAFLVLAAVIMSTAASFTTCSILLSRQSLYSYYSDQAYYLAESLGAESVQRYMRFGSQFSNNYSDWQSPCLQIEEGLCKMDVSLDESGGTIDVWGQYHQTIRHLRFTLSADLNQKISVNKLEEINE